MVEDTPEDLEEIRQLQPAEKKPFGVFRELKDDLAELKGMLEDETQIEDQVAWRKVADKTMRRTQDFKETSLVQEDEIRGPPSETPGAHAYTKKSSDPPKKSSSQF